MVKAKKYKSKKLKLLDINNLERRLENASKKDPRFFKPGDAELQKIQHEFYDMTEEQLHRVVGDMSWQLNPQNHINLYKDYIAEQPILELLRSGLADEDLIANFNKNKPEMAQSPSKRGAHSVMSQQESSAYLASVNSEAQLSPFY